MAPTREDKEWCDSCGLGFFYDIEEDNCLVKDYMPFLDCEYDDICRPCDFHANKFCLECSVKEDL